MTTAQTFEVPARCGKAVKLSAGWSVKLVNTFGSQVVDTWAFNAHDLAEHMSMEHTRVMLGRLNPRKGDQLFSSRRRPLLRMTEDTSPGVHDTLRAACDPVRYTMLGFEKHANCAENLAAALGELGLSVSHSPCPLNMFENCPVGDGGVLVVVPPAAKPGDCVVLTAEMDAIVVFSACPMDVFPTNGPDCKPKAVAYQVLRA